MATCLSRMCPWMVDKTRVIVEYREYSLADVGGKSIVADALSNQRTRGRTGFDVCV